MTVLSIYLDEVGFFKYLAFKSTKFAKNGNPNGEGLPTWNLYSKEKNNLIELGNEVKEIQDPYLKTYPIIQEFMDSQNN